MYLSQLSIVVVILALLPMDTFGQNMTDVLRIFSKGCQYYTKSSTKNTATGFILRQDSEVVGIVTALHSVCGCNEIWAKGYYGREYKNLEVIAADIQTDIALLSSDDIPWESFEGFEFSKLDPQSFQGQQVSMLAFPYGGELLVDVKDGLVRERPSPTVDLAKYVSGQAGIALSARQSPILHYQVLNLNMAITPGCSGAPIIYENKIVGVANGGLDKGRTNICWAILPSNIRLTPVKSLEPKYSELAKKNPHDVFVLTCDLEGNESTSTTTSSVQPCAINLFGDVCFINSSRGTMYIWWYDKEYVIPVNEELCIYDVPEGTHNFKTEQMPKAISGINSAYAVDHQVRVKACKTAKKRITQ